MTKRLSIRSVRPVRYIEILRDEACDTIAATPEYEEFSTFQPIEEVVEEPMISVSDARKQVQNAYDRGFADGKQVATATMMTEIQRQQEVLKNFDTLIENLHAEFAVSINAMERSIVELALIAAEAVINEEVHQDKSVVVTQVKKALTALHGAEDIAVRLNTDDYDALAQAKSMFVSDPSKMAKVKIIADDSVELGGCIVESSLGSIDAQLQVQFHKISEAFKSNIKKSTIETKTSTVA